MRIREVLISTIAGLFGTTLASAGMGGYGGGMESLSSSAAQGSYGAANFIAALFGPFFGALLNAPPELLFENILLFFIIFGVTYMAVQRIEVLQTNDAVIWIVTISVSILAGRFISVEMIYSVLLPYSALGIALSAFLPMLVGFFFVKDLEQPILRRMFWILFCVVFAAMWDMRYFEAGPVSWIYFWTAVVSFLFFLFDGTIRRALMRMELQEQGLQTNEEFSRVIRRELHYLHEDHMNGVLNEAEYQRVKKRLTRQLHRLAKY